MGCWDKTTQKKANKLQVVTTTGMVTDLVQEIGQDLIEVHGLMGPGVDPHLYRPTKDDIDQLNQADIIFYNGLQLEIKMTEVFDFLAQSKPVIAVSNTIDTKQLINSDEYEDFYDPHIWFDLNLWKKAVDVVSDQLIQQLPKHKKQIIEQTSHYLEQLANLDIEINNILAPLAIEKRVLVTAHDAFNYFGKAYQFQVHGLQGMSTQSEAGLEDVQRLASFIVDRRIPAIFVESSISPRQIEAVQAAVKAKGWNVMIGGQLFSDALGNPATPAGTYIGMLKHNVSTIVSALMMENTIVSTKE